MSGIALYPVAFAAGLVSFLSPCVLPLLPGYLSYISGSSLEELQDVSGAQSRRMLVTTLFFVMGFSLVFSLLGSAFGLVGDALGTNRDTAERVAGVVIILMGLFMMGLGNLTALQRESRWMPNSRKGGPLGALPLGMAFAVGWTPCIGPILASIYMLSFSSPGTGASLLLVYSLGLGVPFIVSGLLFSKLTNTLSWFKRHSVMIHRISGGLLVVIGVLLFTGRWTTLVAPLQGLFQLPI